MAATLNVAPFMSVAISVADDSSGGFGEEGGGLRHLDDLGRPSVKGQVFVVKATRGSGVRGDDRGLIWPFETLTWLPNL